jgi:hypothetical protein
MVLRANFSKAYSSCLVRLMASGDFGPGMTIPLSLVPRDVSSWAAAFL